jgi:uncharacterized protein
MENDIRFYETSLEIRTSDNGKTYLRGLASPTYDGSPGSQYRLGETELERFAPGAFDWTLREHPEVEIRANHDGNKVIAVAPTTARMWTDERGLWYEAEADTEISYVKDVVRAVSKKIMRGSSIRFAPVESRWSKEGKDEVRTVTKAYLAEISPVFNPAYKNTTAYYRDLAHWRNQEATRLKMERLEAILRGMHDR